MGDKEAQTTVYKINKVQGCTAQGICPIFYKYKWSIIHVDVWQNQYNIVK